MSKLNNLINKNRSLLSLLLLVVIVILFSLLSFGNDTSKVITQYVVLTSEGFSPKEIKIREGGTLVFTTTLGKPFWPASDMHPTHGIYPEFDPKKPLESDESWSFTFDKPGVWRFHDHLNSTYVGKVEVVGSQSLKNSCSDSSGKIICWQELLDETLERRGLPETFDLLADLYAKEPLFATECHSFVHRIGESAYKKFQKGENFELSSKTSYCGYGFYHGFMEGLLLVTGDIKQAQEFCKYVGIKIAGETTDGEGACYHGIGHGAVDGGLPNLWGNPQKMITEALDMCEKVGGSDRSQYGKLYRCTSGAYNSIEVLASDPKYKLEMIVRDPFYLCPSQKEEYKEGCYTNMIPALLRLTNEDVVKSQKYIEKIPSDPDFFIRKQVTSSLFHEFIRLNLSKENYNKIEGVNICHSLGDAYRIACINGLSGGHMKYGDPNKAHIKGLAFCVSQELRQDETSVCYNHILSRLRVWYSVLKSKEICEGVPEKFRNYCNV